MNARRLLVTAIVMSGFAATSLAIDLDKITVNGYTTLEWEQQLEKKGEGGGDPNGSFDSKSFDLVFNFQVSDKIRAACDIIFEHGSATEDSRGNVAIEYGFVEYSFSDLFKVRAGKFLTPFGIFNEIHTAKPAFLTVHEASSLNQTKRIVRNGLPFYPRYGAGLQFQGDGSVGNGRWDYNVLIANGEQDPKNPLSDNPFESDDNSSKSVTARVRWEPSDQFRVGASYYHDKFSTNNPTYDSVESVGVEFEYENGAFVVWSEAAFGSLKRISGITQSQLGWYIQPSWHFENGFTPYLRFEKFDPNRTITDDHGYDTILGVNYEASRWFQVKLENNWFKGGKNSTLGGYPGRDYNELKAAVVLGF